MVSVVASSNKESTQATHQALYRNHFWQILFCGLWRYSRISKSQSWTSRYHCFVVLCLILQQCFSISCSLERLSSNSKPCIYDIFLSADHGYKLFRSFWTNLYNGFQTISPFQHFRFYEYDALFKTWCRSRDVHRICVNIRL